MATTTETELHGPVGLADHGLSPSGRVHWNPTTALLYTHALRRDEGVLAEGGPLAVDTGRFTGRSPKDKFVVREPGSEERIWWGTVNQPISEEHFEGLREKVVAHLDVQELFVVDAFAGADPAHRIAVRVVTGRAYHALFAKTMFIEPSDDELRAFRPQALVLHASGSAPSSSSTRRGPRSSSAAPSTAARSRRGSSRS
jgi:phosphoenolpyruvate carboxykinase (ATP)